MINDNYVNLNYIVLIDVLKSLKIFHKLNYLLYSIPEHECLVAVENERKEGGNKDDSGYDRDKNAG